jgi:hypothetical protein
MTGNASIVIVNFRQLSPAVRNNWYAETDLILEEHSWWGTMTPDAKPWVYPLAVMDHWPSEKPTDRVPIPYEPFGHEWKAFPTLPGFHLSFSEASGCWSHDGRVLVREEGFGSMREIIINGPHYRKEVIREAVEHCGDFFKPDRFTTDGIYDLVEEPGHTIVMRTIGGHRWRKSGGAVYFPSLGWLYFPVFGSRRHAVMHCRQIDGKVLIRYRLRSIGEPELLIDRSIDPSPHLLAVAVISADFMSDFYQPG